MKGKMKAIFKKVEGRGLEMDLAEVPRPGSNGVLVKVKATSICGSDLHIYQWDRWAKGRIRVPRIIGHELAGEVIKVGDRVKWIRPGDYVSAECHEPCGRCLQCRTGKSHICKNIKILGVDVDGCFAEYVVVPEGNIWHNDPKIPPEHACLQDPLGNAIETVVSAGVTGKTVSVLGCGPIGLMAVGVCRAYGARQILATDLNDRRLDAARRMGAHEALNPQKVDVQKAIRELTGGDGVDVVLEMSGSSQALKTGLKVVTAGGCISLLGIFQDPVDVDLTNDIIFKSVTMRGITGRTMFDTWYKAAGLLQTGSLDLSPLMDEILPMEQFQKGIDLMEKGEAAKVILIP
jgi:threonine 3-dehydrogenase